MAALAYLLSILITSIYFLLAGLCDLFCYVLWSLSNVVLRLCVEVPPPESGDCDRSEQTHDLHHRLRHPHGSQATSPEVRTFIITPSGFRGGFVRARKISLVDFKKVR